VIFEEFKGTGNMELQLDRHAGFNKRFIPWYSRIRNRAWGFTHDKDEMQKMWLLRKYLADMNPMEAVSFSSKMKGTRETKSSYYQNR
jgi:transcription termination factor Rho